MFSEVNLSDRPDNLRYPTGRAWLFAYMRKYRRHLVLGTFYVLVSVSFGVVVPRYVGHAIDDLQKAGVTYASLFRSVATIIGASIISGAFLFVQRRALINMSRYIEFDLRQDFYGHLQRLPLEFFQNHRTGDLMARATNDLGAVRQIVGPAIMYSEQTVFRVLIIVPLMFMISVKLTLILLLTMPLVSLTVKYFGEQIHVRFERIQAFFSDISARAQENLAGVRVVRAYAQEGAEIREFAALNNEFVERNLSLVRLSAVFRPLLQFFIGLGFAVILWYGGRMTGMREMTIGQFAAFNLYLEQLIWPLIAMGYVTNLIQRGTASLKRMHQIMLIEPAIADGAQVTTLPEILGRIEFRNLSYRYASTAEHEKNGGEPAPNPVILKNINLVIEPGQTVAFIGRTGSGKSTLMNLVPRLLDADRGMVLIDDVPIRDLSLSQLRMSIGYVPQETFLFSETLHENIAFGVASASDEEVEWAADVAGLADDIREFPKGFKTLVGERGITLSGGQKQRTAIARAVLRRPRILILDDALSAVDTYTEERILSLLKNVMKARTSLIVAHRISTVKDADLICVLDHGQIIERGTHDELIAHGGAYADLAERQLLEEELEAS